MSTLPALRPICRPMTRSIFDAGKKSAERIISDLFAQGQQGFWLPFTDFASLSQDSSGTLPYTAIQQPVGRVLDRSGRGNHASQPTSTARGVVSARVNQLVSTGSFSGLDWDKLGPSASVVAADVASPLGGMADKIVLAATGAEWSQCRQLGSAIVGVTYASKILIKAAAPVDVGKIIGWRHVGGSAFGLITLSADWSWVSKDEVAALTSSEFTLSLRPGVGTSSGTVSFHLAAADLRLASQSALPYQRVTTPTDYDAVGFPKYLRLDGTDDFYTCGGGGSTTGFYYSDVIRPMGGDGTLRLLALETSAVNAGYGVSINTNNKLRMSAGNGVVNSWLNSTTTLQIGTAYHVAAWDDGVNLNVSINGELEGSAPRPAVVGGPGTFALYRNPSNASYFYTGQATEPIYRAGPPPNAYEREVIRNYQMQKAGML